MSKLRPSDRAIVFSISDGTGKPVPVSRVKDFLEHLQGMVYNIAEMHANLDPSKRGPKGENVRKACDLNIVDMEFESATFALEPPPPEPMLFDMDVGADALQMAFDVFQKFGQNDYEGLRESIPDEHYRSKIIYQAKEAIPPKKTGFHLTARTLQQEIGEVSRPETKALRLFLPEVKAEESDNPSTEKYIDAKGIALLDASDKFIKWKEILSLEKLDDIVTDHVDGEQFRYNFKESLAFKIEKEDALTVLSNERLGIIVHGTNIEEAINALGEEFDFLWEEYAKEGDTELHPSGKALKDALLDIVIETTLHG